MRDSLHDTCNLHPGSQTSHFALLHHSRIDKLFSLEDGRLVQAYDTRLHTHIEENRVCIRRAGWESEVRWKVERHV